MVFIFLRFMEVWTQRDPCKLNATPTYLARDPLRSYFHELQKNEIYFLNGGDSVNNESTGQVVYQIIAIHELRSWRSERRYLTLYVVKTMEFYNLIGCWKRYDAVTAKVISSLVKYDKWYNH